MYAAIQRITTLALLSLVVVSPCMAQLGGPGGTGDIEIDDITFDTTTAKLTHVYWYETNQVPYPDCKCYYNQREHVICH